MTATGKTPEKHQGLSSKALASLRESELGNWDFFGVWSLMFGVFNLVFGAWNLQL
jgi:hypothetical protein